MTKLTVDPKLQEFCKHAKVQAHLRNAPFAIYRNSLMEGEYLMIHDTVENRHEMDTIGHERLFATDLNQMVAA